MTGAESSAPQRPEEQPVAVAREHVSEEDVEIFRRVQELSAQVRQSGNTDLNGRVDGPTLMINKCE